MQLASGQTQTAWSRWISPAALTILATLSAAGSTPANPAPSAPTSSASKTTSLAETDLKGAKSGAADFVRDIQPILAEQCYGCHGVQKHKGGLRLDSRSAAMAGGTSGPTILPGHAADSSLIRRVRGEGDEDRMPLKKPPLPEAQVRKLAAWIDQGAKWPDSAAGEPAMQSKHWAFVPPVRPAEPEVKDTSWVRNPIDRFVLSRLEKEGIRPSPEAPKQTLLRRVSLDLTGLPPTPEEMDRFLADESPEAYEKVVDRLLASPHYGERWARHWLDAARYADSNGYSIDAPRSIWKYRDWVIDAINRDLPYDQFVIEQLAGDLLPAPSGAEGSNAALDQKIATGFHRNTQINEEGGIDPEQFRVEAIVDRVATTGTVLLGLTVGCAQCHNHKFDPISQKEYYQLFAFFNSADEPTLKITTPEEDRRLRDLRERIAALEAERKQAATPATPATPATEKGKTPKRGRAKTETDQQIAALKKQQAEIGVTTLVMSERPEPRPSFVFIKGDFTRHGEPVSPGVPAVLPPLRIANGAPAHQPNRLDLARWIVDSANPLTARVEVNRFWLHYFGNGIVETENDFGSQGDKPSHPELLDWLATELVRQNWSTKAIHRLIVTSSTYRQSSNARPDLAVRDSGNRLLARQSRVRLDAEIVRDVALCASGLYCDKIGGPSVFPPQPEGVMGLGQVKREWKTSTGCDRYRRGMYTFTWRSTLHPLLGSFDAPDGTSACTRRLRSNTPLQSLTLLNDAAFIEFARALAGRVLRDAPPSDADKVDLAFRLCLSRAPSPDERQVLLDLLVREKSAFAQVPDEAKALSADRCPPGTDLGTFAAWTIVSRAVLNVDEAMTRE